jgi:hypothetical protein
METGAVARIQGALRRSRFGIWTIALTYCVSVAAGMAMVHLGNRFALEFRDNLVGKAYRESVILRQWKSGRRLSAAGMDAAGNSLAGLVSMLAGYCPPAGYAVVAHRGWIGGVVSVDGEHQSRLGSARTAFYYLMTLLLQLIPSSLVGGAGVSVGIATFTRKGGEAYPGPRMPGLRIPYDALKDAGRIYLASLPLFAAASLFEFLM